MAILRKDVNFGLIILILATLVAFAGFATYYSATFQNLTDAYQNKLNDFEKVTKDLMLYKGKLNETSFALEIKQARESDLGAKYMQIKKEKETLENDKRVLENELVSKTNELISKRQEISTLSSELAEVRLDLERANRRIDDLEDETERLCDKLKGLTPPQTC